MKSSDSSAVSSLLERLTPSDLARKRKVSCNLPPIGMKRSKGGCSALHMKSVSPYDCVKAYADEYFQVCNKKLFCQACREELSLKKSVIDNHIKSVKHTNSKLKVVAKESRTMKITKALKNYDASAHPKGETLLQSSSTVTRFNPLGSCPH